MKKRILLLILCILMVVMYIPPVSYAATTLTFVTVTDSSGVEHTFSNDSSGDGYTYVKSTNTLTLNNFTGQSILTDGDLNVHLVGTNVINIDKNASSLYGFKSYRDGSMGEFTFSSEEGATLDINGSDLPREVHGIHGYIDFLDNCDITITLSGATMNSWDNMYGTWGHINYDGSDSNLTIDITSQNAGYGKIYGVYNGGIVVNDGSDDNSLTINLHPLASQSVMALDYIYLYTEEFELDIAIDDNRANDTVERVALGGMNKLNRITGGHLSFNGGTIRTYSMGQIASPLKSTVPTDSNFCLYHQSDNNYYFCDLSGNKLYNLTLVPQDGDYSPKFVGDSLLSLPSLYVGDSLYQQNGNRQFYFLGYIRNLSSESNISCSVVSGSLPAGLSVSNYGQVTGTPTAECEAGSCVIRVTDGGNSNKYCEFTLNYGAVIEKDRFITIDGTKVEMRSTVNNPTWSYDGTTKTLTLNNYNGGQIKSEKAFNLHLVGNNTIHIPNEVSDNNYGIMCGSFSLLDTMTISGNSQAKLTLVGSELDRTTYCIYARTNFESNVNLSINASLSETNSCSIYGIYGTINVLGDNNNITLELTDKYNGTSSKYIYGLYNGSFIVKGDNNKVNININPAPYGRVSALDSLDFNDTDVELKVNISGKCNDDLTNRIAIGGIQNIKDWTGLIDVNGGLIKLSYNAIDNIKLPITCESPIGENFCFTHGGSYHYLCDLNGEYISKVRLIPNEDSYSPKYVGGTSFMIPKMVVGDNLNYKNGYSEFNIRYALSGISSSDNLTCEIISGTLPAGLTMNKRGKISGIVSSVCEAGTVRIRVTDNGNDDKSVEFDLAYGGVIDHIEVSSINCNLKYYEMTVGEVYNDLTVNVTPFNVVEPHVTAVSSDSSVVEVLSVGDPISGATNISIRANKPGHAYITYTAVDNGKTTVTEVYVMGEMPGVYDVQYVNVNSTEHSNPSTYKVDEEVILTNPTRDGYTFLGWYKESSFKTKVTKIALGTAGKVTLYAKWSANTYTVSYNRNGGTSGTMKSVVYTYGKSYKLTKNVFSKTGYTFTGWNTEPDGSGTSFTNLQAVSNLTPTNKGVVTLFAQWSLNDYQIKYVNVTAEEITDTLNPTSYSYEDSLITLNNPTRTGYVFSGWYLDSKYKKSGNIIANHSTGAKTFYAKWTPIKYSVKFNSNTGIGTMKNEAFTYGTSLALSANLFKKTGYNFVGWTTDPENLGTVYTNKQKVSNLTTTNGEVVNLYAKWELANYTITYYGMTAGELELSGNPTTYTILDSDILLNAGDSEGRTFVNWYSDSKYKKIANTTIPAGSTGNKVFYPKWSNPAKYTVSFNGKGGTGTMKNQVMTYGTTTKLYSNAFKNPGYNFVGWSVLPSGFGPTLNNGQAVNDLEIEGTITLYAKWEKAIYSIKYVNVTADELTLSGNPTSYTYTDSLITLTNPTRTGYVFSGWYLDSKYKKSAGNKITQGSTGNKVFYAKWTPIKYSVKFNSNGGTGTMKNEAFSYGSQLALTTNVFKKTGYVFVGWNTEADGTGTTYSNKAKVKNLASTNGEVVNLYAIWNRIDYSITYGNVTAAETLKAANPTKYNVTTSTFTISSPEREGYIFSGWYSDSKLKKKATLLTIKKGSTGAKVYYAKWTPITYKVSFNSNTGTGTMKDLTFTYGKSAYLTANAFTKPGYTFAGWNTESDRTGKWYSNKELVANLINEQGSTITLYAQWNIIE